MVHDEASAILADAWKLSPEVALVIGNHHRPWIGGRLHPLAAVVCVADAVASSIGAGFVDEVNEGRAQEAAAGLGIASRQLDEVTKQGRAVLDLL